MTRYLFLCAEGRMRSATAVTVARRLAALQGMRIVAENGGILYLRKDSVPDLLERFDRFIVMEDYMVTKLVEFGVERGRIVCLNIPDRYGRDDDTLVSLLEKKLAVEFGGAVGS